MEWERESAYSPMYTFTVTGRVTNATPAAIHLMDAPTIHGSRSDPALINTEVTADGRWTNTSDSQITIPAGGSSEFVAIGQGVVGDTSDRDSPDGVDTWVVETWPNVWWADEDYGRECDAPPLSYDPVVI